jgi:hypothetical protein
MFIEAETVRSAWFGLSRAYLRGITDMLAVSAGCSVDGSGRGGRGGGEVSRALRRMTSRTSLAYS